MTLALDSRARPRTSSRPAILPAAYREATSGLLDGGSDLLLVETVFDTLNCKAALFAIEEEFAARGARVPVMVSVTITDRSGRTLSGQTPEAFWISIAHARPLSVGLNCALGPKELTPHLRELSRVMSEASSPAVRKVHLLAFFTRLTPREA